MLAFFPFAPLAVSAPDYIHNLAHLCDTALGAVIMDERIDQRQSFAK